MANSGTLLHEGWSITLCTSQPCSPSRGPTSSPCICSLHPSMTVFGQNCELLSLVWYYHYLNVTSIPSYWMTGLLLIYTVHTRNLPFCGWLVNLKEQQCYGTALLRWAPCFNAYYSHYLMLWQLPIPVLHLSVSEIHFLFFFCSGRLYLCCG